MMIDRATHRIRAFLSQPDVKVDQIARAVGLSWETVKKAADPTSNPTLDTLRRLEAAIPPDFTPHPQDHAA